jgi:hypothetical protein
MKLKESHRTVVLVILLVLAVIITLWLRKSYDAQQLQVLGR